MESFACHAITSGKETLADAEPPCVRLNGKVQLERAKWVTTLSLQRRCSAEVYPRGWAMPKRHHFVRLCSFRPLVSQPKQKWFRISRSLTVQRDGS
jgi:hypothetical protein